MVTETITNILKILWPALIIILSIVITLRITYLIINKKPIVLYKELLSLAFITYILSLFYIVTFEDVSWGTENLIPFKEITRYTIGSRLFLKNVLGNMIIFLPYGFFIGYYIKPKKGITVFFLIFLTSIIIEFTQAKIGRVFDVDDIILNISGGMLGFLIYKIINNIHDKLPPILKKRWILNIMVIVLIGIIIAYYIYKK